MPPPPTRYFPSCASATFAHTHTPHLSVLAHVCLLQLEGERWDGGLAAVGAEPSHIRQFHKRGRVLCTRCGKHGTRSQRQPRCWLQSISSHSCSFSLQPPTHTHTQPSLPFLLSVSTPCCPWRLGASMPSAWYCTLTRKYTCSGACSSRTTKGVLALRGSNDSDSRVKLDTSA